MCKKISLNVAYCSNSFFIFGRSCFEIWALIYRVQFWSSLFFCFQVQGLTKSISCFLLAAPAAASDQIDSRSQPLSGVLAIDFLWIRHLSVFYVVFVWVMNFLMVIANMFDHRISLVWRRVLLSIDNVHIFYFVFLALILFERYSDFHSRLSHRDVLGLYYFLEYWSTGVPSSIDLLAISASKLDLNAAPVELELM